MTTTLSMPAAVNGGVRVQTLNQFGWMVNGIIQPVGQFIELAAKSSHWSLEIGCAYGAHTLEAIKAGARVVANDRDARHLEILEAQVPPELSQNLKTVSGIFPNVDLPLSSFEAILACRVLHFFDGKALEQTAEKMFALLVPGGKVFIKVVTAYVKMHQAFIPEYERRKASGEKWPGFVPDISPYLTDEQELAALGNQQLHFLEPDILSRTFESAGFIIDKCEFDPITLEWVHLDGRESVVLIASKPLS